MSPIAIPYEALSTDDKIRIQVALDDIKSLAENYGEVTNKLIFSEFADFYFNSGAVIRVSNWRKICLEDTFEVQYSIVVVGHEKTKFKKITPVKAEEDPADWWKSNEN